MPYEVMGAGFQNGHPPSPQALTNLLDQGEANGWQFVQIVVGNDFIYIVFKR